MEVALLGEAAFEGTDLIGALDAVADRLSGSSSLSGLKWNQPTKSPLERSMAAQKPNPAYRS
jgi:hypothetical protein